jgi:MFS family permease
MLNLLVDPIKRSLILSDTQFSLIQGTAFVSAYLAAAPIFGRLVDVTNRRNILIFGVCAWSVCTALCGLANSYGILFLARFGVGVSEACVFPVSMSLIADYFSAQRAPRALSILTIGSQLGGGFSLVASGLVIAFAGRLRLQFPSFETMTTWQMAFVVIGLPGLLFALLLFSLREPKRRQILATDAAEKPLSMRQVASALWTRRNLYGRIYLTIGMIGVVQLGIPSWFPSFLIRAHGMPASATGLELGTLSVLVGSTGTLLGPIVSRWLERAGYTDAPLRAAAFGMIGMFFSCVAIPLAPGSTGALCVAAGMIFFCGFPTGIIAAATQHATPSRVQGVVASFYTFSAQLIGYGIGPTAIALVTDRVFHDPKMVGYSMEIVMSTASVVACLLLFSALKHYRKMMSEMSPTRSPPPAEPA